MLSQQLNSSCYTPHRPKRSSPLVSDASSPLSPSHSSPLSAAESRRRSQYKSRTPSSSISAGRTPTARSPGYLFQSFVRKNATASEPAKDIIRQKFQTRCFKRAARAREHAVKEKRYQDAPNSDPFGPDDMDMDDDYEESEDSAMSDELYRRIVAHANTKFRRNYSTLDSSIVGCPTIALDFAVDWEAELKAEEVDELTPEDRELAELEAYIQEYETRSSPGPKSESDLFDYDWDEFEEDNLDTMDIS